MKTSGIIINNKQTKTKLKQNKITQQPTDRPPPSYSRCFSRSLSLLYSIYNGIFWNWFFTFLQRLSIQFVFVFIFYFFTFNLAVHFQMKMKTKRNTFRIEWKLIIILFVCLFVCLVGVLFGWKSKIEIEKINKKKKKQIASQIASVW